MKKLELLIIILITCAYSKPRIDFIDAFVGSESDTTIYTKLIQQEHLDIILATNEINPSILNKEHKYYYGFKKKLDNEHLLISYIDTYTPQYMFTHKLIGWRDEFYCIYNAAKNQVVSKLRVSSSDPVFSNFKMRGNHYVVISTFIKFLPKESDCNDIVIQKDTSTTTYQILNNRFVEIVERK